MRIARRTFLAATAAAIAAPAVMRVARADAPQVTLKLHHFMSSVSSAHDKFIVPWARKVQADSNGRIRIDIFPSMQLGGAPAHLFDQARDGDADIVWTAPGLTPGRFAKIEMFDLPFVPSRRALVSSKALEDFAAVNLKDEFREVRPLCFSCADRGVIHANAPIRTVEDVKDLKIHVSTRFAGEALHLLGAQPVPMPVGQLQLAVNQRVIDGCLDPWHLMPALRLNDILKTHTEFSDFSPSSTTFVLAMNNAAYDRLPRDLKAVIDSNSGQTAAGMAGAMWDLEAASVADTVVRGGDSIVTLLPEAVAHWRKLTEPVVEKWLKEMKEQKTDGGKLLASVRTLLVKYANEPEPQPPQPVSQPPQQQTVSQPPQPTASQPPPQSLSQQQGLPQQALPQQPPQTGLSTPPKINAPAAPTPAATSSAAPPAGPVAKPLPPQPPQPPAPRVATPSPAPAPATIAKPVPPAAPPPPAAAPPSAASVSPAAKPAAAPVLAQPPTPTPPPTAAAAPPPVPMPAPVPPAPKPVPKSLDIPL
jgi:TRAP-type transport system periplasmic protein